MELDKMEKGWFAFMKVCRIIGSCTTKEQLKTAANCVNNYFRLYPEDEDVKELENLILLKYESL